MIFPGSCSLLVCSFYIIPEKNTLTEGLFSKNKTWESWRQKAIHQQIFYALPLNFNISILLCLFVGFLVLKVSAKPHSIQNLISYPLIISVFRLTAVLYGKYSYLFARSTICTVQVYCHLSNNLRNVENIWSHNKRHKTTSFTCWLHIPTAQISISLRN